MGDSKLLVFPIKGRPF